LVFDVSLSYGEFRLESHMLAQLLKNWHPKRWSKKEVAVNKSHFAKNCPGAVPLKKI